MSALDSKSLIKPLIKINKGDHIQIIDQSDLKTKKLDKEIWFLIF